MRTWRAELSTYHKSYMCHPLCLCFCTYMYIYIYVYIIYSCIYLYIYIYMYQYQYHYFIKPKNMEKNMSTKNTHIKFNAKKRNKKSQDSESHSNLVPSFNLQTDFFAGGFLVRKPLRALDSVHPGWTSNAWTSSNGSSTSTFYNFSKTQVFWSFEVTTLNLTWISLVPRFHAFVTNFSKLKPFFRFQPTVTGGP